ncbi:MAG: peptidylprolyl isomerase [Lachnospiraceae bacterium]|nr:peptidylprolyl isomerase [Lachnospiraceae bacterium]
MKKNVITAALAAIMIGLTACGETMIPADQVEADITAQYEALPTKEPEPTKAAPTEAAVPTNPAAEGRVSKHSGEEVYATIDVADYGKIVVKLEPDEAPITVDNFVDLAESGFYNGLTFHRIMDSFMIQGGDPTGTGKGGSSETIIGEFADNGIPNNITHVKGTISMGRNGFDNDSASSQFFICNSDYNDQGIPMPQVLDGRYAAFGNVVEGIEVVDAITADKAPLETDGNGGIPYEDQPVMNSVTITYGSY